MNATTILLLATSTLVGAAAHAPAPQAAPAPQTTPAPQAVPDVAPATLAVPAPASAPVHDVVAPQPASADAEPGFIATYWPWMCALLALPLAGWLWAWHAHRSAYDEAGLPRGPKL